MIELAQQGNLDVWYARLDTAAIVDERASMARTASTHRWRAPSRPRWAMPCYTAGPRAELFRGTLLRHSLVAVRSDATRPFAFGDRDAAAYIPLRMSDTLCVTERLPPGAAAVLLYRTHTFTDIVLPIDARQKRMFDAIDGQRTVAALDDDIAAASAFVETLRWVGA